MNMIFASIIIIAGVLGAADNIQKLTRKHISFTKLSTRQKVINILLLFIIANAVTMLMQRAITYFLPDAHVFGWVAAAVIGILMSLRPFLEDGKQ